MTVPREPSVNTGAGIIEIVRSAAIKSVLEEVLQDVKLAVLHASMGSHHHVLNMTDFRTSGNCFYNLNYRIENPGNLTNDQRNIERAACRGTIYLGIFVYECESIGDVVVAKMNNAGADPGADLLLGSVDDLVHGPPDRRSRLDPVETLQVK